MIFHEDRLSQTGTSVALYDYAYFCRKYLNINPIIVSPKEEKHLALDKFKKEFDVFLYDSVQDIQKLIDNKNINNFYSIKFGVYDDLVFKNCRNLAHAVFFCHFCHYHGDVYAFVSEYMSIFKDTKIPFVPHMINLPECNEDLRSELNIPKDALVLGRYGSYDTFNIDFVKEVVAEESSKIYFIFANTEKFYDHPNIIYLPPIIDLYNKVKFINTCNAMLHARDYGETFGLSVLEFACKNKQIISYDNEVFQNEHPLGGRNHFMFLGNNCHKYKNKNDLKNIINNLNKNSPFDTNYLNEKFSPKNVINKFKDVFLKDQL